MKLIIPYKKDFRYKEILNTIKKNTKWYDIVIVEKEIVTFLDCLEFIDKNEPFIIANSDIEIPYEEIQKIEIKPKTVSFLTRYENNELFEVEPIGCSQDVFYFHDKPDILPNIPIGRMGSENSLAFFLFLNGYELNNPSKDVKTYHHHKKRKKYKKERIQSPYLYLPPHSLNEKSKKIVSYMFSSLNNYVEYEYKNEDYFIVGNKLPKKIIKRALYSVSHDKYWEAICVGGKSINHKCNIFTSLLVYPDSYYSIIFKNSKNVKNSFLYNSYIEPRQNKIYLLSLRDLNSYFFEYNKNVKEDNLIFTPPLEISSKNSIKIKKNKFNIILNSNSNLETITYELDKWIKKPDKAIFNFKGDTLILLKEKNNGKFTKSKLINENDYIVNIKKNDKRIILHYPNWLNEKCEYTFTHLYPGTILPKEINIEKKLLNKNRIFFNTYWISCSIKERDENMKKLFKSNFNFGNIIKIDGIKPNDTEIIFDDIATRRYNSFNEVYGNNSGYCWLSHLKAIQTAKNNNEESILILEDDCEIDKYDNKAFYNVPNDWDVLVLGYKAMSPCIPYNSNWNIAGFFVLAHSIIYRNTTFDFILSQSCPAYDDWISRVLRKEFKIYLINEPIFYQKDMYSLIDNIDKKNLKQDNIHQNNLMVL